MKRIRSYFLSLKIKLIEFRVFIKRMFCFHAYEHIASIGEYPDEIRIAQCVDCKKIIITN